YGGLVDEWSASLNPVQFAYELAQVVAKYGGVVCENAGVTRIEHLPQGFRVYTNKGEVRAREIVLATNGYTGGLIPRIQQRMFAVGSYAVVTEPLPLALQQEINPNRRGFYDSQRFLHYFRLTPDGRFLFGGRNEWALDENLVVTAKAFRKEMVRIFPQLTDVEITHSWNGRLGISFDFIPHIGRMSGVHYALGYSGHGVALATYLGTELGLLLTGQKKRSVFVDVPHPTRFYHRKAPWYLPAVRWYYRLRDWLGR
ncbi:MAG: FAD-binding oxidoreductase, partial [Ardenticatenaceae bacterium]|nr:FAD-binding oxidoreductase [Ardenticatenaceae bacterium]